MSVAGNEGKVSRPSEPSRVAVVACPVTGTISLHALIKAIELSEFEMDSLLCFVTRRDIYVSPCLLTGEFAHPRLSFAELKPCVYASAA